MLKAIFWSGLLFLTGCGFSSLYDSSNNTYHGLLGGKRLVGENGDEIYKFFLYQDEQAYTIKHNLGNNILVNLANNEVKVNGKLDEKNILAINEISLLSPTVRQQSIHSKSLNGSRKLVVVDYTFSNTRRSNPSDLDPIVNALNTQMYFSSFGASGSEYYSRNKSEIIEIQIDEPSFITPNGCDSTKLKNVLNENNESIKNANYLIVRYFSETHGGCNGIAAEAHLGGGQMVIYSGQNNFLTVITHEHGHSLGLNHSGVNRNAFDEIYTNHNYNTAGPQYIEYGDKESVMGSSHTYLLNGPHRLHKGWLSNDEIYNYRYNEHSTLDLEALDIFQHNNYEKTKPKLIRIGDGHGSFIYTYDVFLEYRTGLDHRGAPIPSMKQNSTLSVIFTPKKTNRNSISESLKTTLISRISDVAAGDSIKLDLSSQLNVNTDFSNLEILVEEVHNSNSNQYIKLRITSGDQLNDPNRRVSNIDPVETGPLQPEIIGIADFSSYKSVGNGFSEMGGWTCAKDVDKSIAVHLHKITPTGIEPILAQNAKLSLSDSANINVICGTHSVGHRFHLNFRTLKNGEIPLLFGVFVNDSGIQFAEKLAEFGTLN